VPQQKLSQLKNDMDVRITSDAHPESIFTVGLAAQIQQSLVHHFDSLALRNGISVPAKIIEDRSALKSVAIATV
jgi:hypothetical protein